MPKNDIPSIRRILHKRTLPGLLLFDSRGKLLSLNSVARQILGQSHQRRLLHAIRSSLQSLKKTGLKSRSALRSPNRSLLQAAFSSQGHHYGLRVFLLDKQPDRPFNVIAVLLERITSSRFDLRKAQRLFGLSPREVEVIEAVKMGMTDKEIASALGIGSETVRGYLKTIRAKLGVSTRTAILDKILSI
jgi:DNA-binding CsgD family transcriptional regulator